MTVFSKLSALLATTGGAIIEANTDEDGQVVAPVKPSGQTQQVVTAEHADAACVAARAEGVTEGKLEGAKEANTRFAAVMASDEGKADPALAVFMLTKSAATSEEIIADLKSRPAPAAAGGAPKPGDASAQASLESTPKADLAAAPNGGENEEKKEDIWATTIVGAKAPGTITAGGPSAGAAQEPWRAQANG